MAKVKLMFAAICLCGFTLTQAAIVVGNPNGKVTLTEVMDYQCIHCHNMQPVVDYLLQHDPDLKVRVIPVAVVNDTSLYQASAGYVIAKESHDFMQYDHILMQRAYTQDQTADWLTQEHLNTPVFQSEMHQKWVLNNMAEGLSLLNQYHSGTPFFLITPTNKPSQAKVFAGETDPQAIIAAVEEATHA